MFASDYVKSISDNEKGVSMVEAAIAMPLYMMCILFIPAVIPFMFNMLGAHYASVVSLREIAAGGNGNGGISIEQQLHATLQNNFRVFTAGVGLENVTIGSITVNTGVRQEQTSPASCLLDGSCPIPPGGFVSISTDIRFIDLTAIGLPDFTSTTLAIMRMNEF